MTPFIQISDPIDVISILSVAVILGTMAGYKIAEYINRE